MDNTELARLIRDSHGDLKADMRLIREDLTKKADKKDHEDLERRVRGNEATLIRAKGAFAALAALGTTVGGWLGFRH